MDKFRDAYREASKELPRISLSVENVRDEIHHHKMQRQRRKILLARGCTAAVLFILCGVGTVAAKNYRESIISVGDSGFVITSVQEEEQTAKANDLDGIQDMSAFLKLGGAFSIEDAFPDESSAEPYGADVCESEIAEYDSVEEFLANEDMVIAVPERSLFSREFTSERVCVIEKGLDVHLDYMSEDSYFTLHQADNRGYESYSSATSYMGRSCNERSFVNSQGLSYVVFDTVDERGEIESVHAVISVNGRDLAMSFGGFEKEEIERVLNGLDLTVYYRD